MNYNDFLSLINDHSLKSTYLFMGEEKFIVDKVLKAIKEKYIEESFETFNYSVLDGKIISITDLINTCETLPFMSPKKIVIVNDTNSFIEKIDDKGKLTLIDYLNDLGSYICLIFNDNYNELKRTSFFYKYYSKNKIVVEFEKFKGRELQNWVDKYIKNNNLSITSSDINYLIQNSSYVNKATGATLYDLEHELNKLKNFSNRGEINKSTIDYVMIKSLDNNIFDLLQAINNGDTQSSIFKFNDIYQSGEAIPKILFMIIRQVRLMLGYNIFREKGYTDGDIIEKLKIKPYEYSKISAQAKSYKSADLERYLSKLLETDIKLKSISTDEKTLIEILLVNLSKRV